jgi:large subunit ribosomal protein L4
VQATVYDIKGNEVRTVDLDDSIFGIEPNKGVMHQALVRQHANGRQGTASTKTRQEVRGGGKKPYRQKGTGNARQGSRRAPHYRGGAVIFGPKPRKYTKDMPRKMRRLAIRSALSLKFSENAITFVDSWTDLEPRTKAMNEVLNALNVAGEKVLLIHTGRTDNDNLYRAAGNLPRVKTLVASYINMDDMFKYTKVVMPVDALEQITSLWSLSKTDEAVEADSDVETDADAAVEADSGSEEE